MHFMVWVISTFSIITSNECITLLYRFYYKFIFYKKYSLQLTSQLLAIHTNKHLHLNRFYSRLHNACCSFIKVQWKREAHQFVGQLKYKLVLRISWELRGKRVINQMFRESHLKNWFHMARQHCTIARPSKCSNWNMFIFWHVWFWHALQYLMHFTISFHISHKRCEMKNT